MAAGLQEGTAGIGVRFGALHAALLRWLGDRNLPRHVVVLGLLFTGPALLGGLYLDDFIHRLRLLRLDGWPGVLPPWLGLFTFVPDDPSVRAKMADLGLVPWWHDPGVQISFFRPLSALTHALDYRLWPNHPLPQHAHSLLWFGLGLWAAARLYRRVMPTAVAAGLAAVMFTVEDGHALPAYWIANRNALTGLLFGLLAIHAHVTWRETGLARHGAMAALTFLTALCASELAVGAFGYVAAYELTLARGSWLARLRASFPQAAVAVAWSWAYRSLGFGVRGSSLYIDPLTSPSAFVGSALEHAPVLLADQWLHVPASISMLLPAGWELAFSLLASLLVSGLCVWLAPTVRESPTARFWALGMLLALVPACSSAFYGRTLPFVGFGAFGLLAEHARRLGWLGETASKVGGRLARATLGLVLVLHLPVAALMLCDGVARRALRGDPYQAAYSAIPADAGIADQTAVLVSSSDLVNFYVFAWRSSEGRHAPRRLLPLASLGEPLEISRPGLRTLRIRPRHGFLARPMDRTFAPPRVRFRAGQRIPLPDCEVEVVRTLPDGRPEVVDFHFAVPLDSPSLRWLHWGSQGFEPFAVPEPGETRTITSGPPWL